MDIFNLLLFQAAYHQKEEKKTPHIKFATGSIELLSISLLEEMGHLLAVHLDQFTSLFRMMWEY